jgi:hypothetical protein
VQVTTLSFLGSRTGPGTPVISPFTNVVQIAAGDRDTCAIVAGGAVRCWGDGTAGQLGLGVSSTQFRPASVPSFTVNILPAVRLDEDRTVTVTIVAVCDEGERLHIGVNFAQGDAAGVGVALVECTGGIERYPVTVHAHGRASFQEGPADVEAAAFIRNRGVIIESQEWTRHAEVAAAP